VSLVDTPGFMVGPDTEATGQVRHVSRLFIAAAHLRVPYLSVVLRKGYGLGAMAMTAGGFHSPLFTAAWPTGEFGAMGLEGAVRLGFKKELLAVPEGPGREALFQRLLAQQTAAGSGINMATTLEIDAVIDPADTRRWVTAGLQTAKIGVLQGAAVDSW
jgi:acetyl-CoA carboxylase carboxyltransferase component